MSKTLTSIRGKQSYYKQQESKRIKEYIRTNSRIHRDDVIRIQERLATYEEVIELLNKEL